VKHCFGITGLEYLHSGSNQSIIHRDVKTSNILLHSDMENAKIADFGLSILMYGKNITHVTTNVKGTTGYVDPEYLTSQCLTPKSDVYSFGVVLLEIISGRKVIDPTLPNQEIWNLCDWVRFNLQGGNISKTLDPIVKASNPNLDALWKVIKIAIQCVESKAIRRPTMTKVVEELRNAINLQEGNPLSSNYSHNMTYEILDQYGSQMQLLDSQ
jgi:serine/threonine protein kinase